MKIKEALAYLKENDFQDNYITQEVEDLDRNGLPLNAYYGCTRVVIITEDDYVLKKDICYYFNNGRRQKKDGVNFCEKEAKLYELAVREKLQQFFLKTIYLSQNTSVQEKCIPLDESGCDFNDKICLDDIYESYYLENEVILSQLVCQFGIDNVNRFIIFLENHNINDLHEGNWGWNKNGNLVLIDYAGKQEG